MISYLVKANLLFFVIYLGYYIGFRRGDFYQHNRIYLLLGVLFSLIAPLFNLSIFSNTINTNSLPTILLPEVLISDSFTVVGSSISTLGTLVYIVVSLVLVGLFIIGVLKICRIVQSAEKEVVYGKTVYLIEVPKAHFTFLNFIVIAKNTNPDMLNYIIKHEEIHQKEWHSVDLIIAELVKIVFWYNPFVWFIKKAMAENHEFIADAKAAGAEKNTYSNWLYNGLIDPYVPVIANSFFTKNQLKTRLIMLHKQSNIKKAIVRYGLAATVLSTGLFVVSCTEQALEPTEVAEEVQEVTKNQKEMKVDQMPEFPGGMEAMVEYLQTNIKYPESAKADKAEGKVIVSFVVDSEGNLASVRAMNKIHPDLDEAAVEVVKSMPTWAPGSSNGKTVPVEMKLPIMYALN